LSVSVHKAFRMSHDIPTVLVVEDEPLIRMNAVDTIERAGFNVIEASDAEEAIAVLEHNSDIRVVFTDIHLPGSMDGLKLLAAIRNRWPPIKLIATSGHVRVKDDDLPGGGRFIAKPYRADQLTSMIRTAIG
jgi:CheY-like chemotaxis protein